ncbi:MAG: hypothetical protein AAGH89_12090 [Verrucomicrobiota bacterium]
MNASIQLRNCPLAILNQLFHLDGVRMTVRGSGLSLTKYTEFGVFFQVQDGDRLRWSDPVSGLTIDPGALRSIYAIPICDTLPPALEFEFVGERLALSIQPNVRVPESNTLDRIIEAFAAKPTSTQRLLEHGAGAWLDEWSEGRNSISDKTDQESIRKALHETGVLRVLMDLPGLTADAVIRPDWFDANGSILKIANVQDGSVVFADLESSANRFEDDLGALNLFHQIDERPILSSRRDIPEFIEPYSVNH